MTNIRDIIDRDALEREFERIRNFFKHHLEKNEILRIEWGTKEAFEKLDKQNIMFKIAVSKDGKFLNFLCEEHRYVGSIWLSELEFFTLEDAEKWIKTHRHAEETYTWTPVEVKK